MAWARLRVVSWSGGPMLDPDGRPQERLFNLDQLQWWIGRGSDRVELQYASQPPIFVEVSDVQMERLIGTTGDYGGA